MAVEAAAFAELVAAADRQLVAVVHMLVAAVEALEHSVDIVRTGSTVPLHHSHLQLVFVSSVLLLEMVRQTFRTRCRSVLCLHF